MFLPFYFCAFSWNTSVLREVFPFLCGIFVEQLCNGCADKPAGICGLLKRVCVAAHLEQKIAVRQIHVVFALRKQNRSHQSGIHRLAGLLQSYRKAQSGKSLTLPSCAPVIIMICAAFLPFISAVGFILLPLLRCIASRWISSTT